LSRSGKINGCLNRPLTGANVQKKAAYILLAAFIVLQFAKQVSYAECRLANYFAANGQPCDCEKIFAEKTGQDQSTQLPASHQHLHIDDVYSFASTVTEQVWYSAGTSRHITTAAGRWINAITGSIDRPPAGIAFSWFYM
jgi:hypothetical protein